MQISTFMLYGLIEGIVFLVLLAVFLILLVRKAHQRSDKLQQKINNLLMEYQELHGKLLEEREEHRVTNTYRKQITDQLTATKQYHKTLGADRDITLDLNPESPPNRQTAAIRHAILVAEKEALNASENGMPNWAFLETKLLQLMRFYSDLKPRKDPAPSAEESPEDKVMENHNND